jgi:hypothetical protein
MKFFGRRLAAASSSVVFFTLLRHRCGVVLMFFIVPCISVVLVLEIVYSFGQGFKLRASISLPHQIVGCVHGGKNGETFNVPYSKLVEPVQNIQSFLQNSPNRNPVAGFVEQDMPSGYEFFSFHLIKFTPSGGSLGIAPAASQVDGLIRSGFRAESARAIDDQADHQHQAKSAATNSGSAKVKPAATKQK